MNNELLQKINKLYDESELFQDFNGYILIKEGNDILFQQGFGYSDFEVKKIAPQSSCQI